MLYIASIVLAGRNLYALTTRQNEEDIWDFRVAIPQSSQLSLSNTLTKHKLEVYIEIIVKNVSQLSKNLSHVLWLEPYITQKVYITTSVCDVVRQ